MKILPYCLYACLLLLSYACGQETAAPTDSASHLPRISTEFPYAPRPRPNILWLTCEDISPMLPMFGDSTVETPNLSRLAARGIRFPNTFSTAGVCAPSRYTLATGRYPIADGGQHMRTQGNFPRLETLGLKPYGALPPPEVKMLSQIMRENGYFATNNKKTDYQFKPLKTGWDELGPRAHWRHRPDEKMPFFAIFNMEITHESQVWTTGKMNLRFVPGFEKPDADDSKVLALFQGKDRPPLTVAEDAELPLPPYLVDAPGTRTDMRRVYSNIEILDRQVGLILDQLEEDGLDDNTIIIFHSDHGGPLPRQKRLLYDSGLRVPHFAVFPDERRAGTIDSTLISFVDMPPTMLRLAGIPLPDYLHGQPYLGEDLPAPRSYIFAASDRLDGFYDRIRAARDQRFKYLRNFYPERGYYLPVKYREQMTAMQELLEGRDAGTLSDAQAQWFRKSKPAEELFDTQNDPYELRNLAEDPAYADKLAELRGAMDDWMAEVGDRGAVPEVEMVQGFWEGADDMPQTGRPQLKRDSLGRFVLYSSTPGAQIAYQITSPGQTSDRWLVYSEPLTYERGDTLRAVAQRIGYRQSGESLGY